MSTCMELERQHPLKRFIHLEVGQPNFNTPPHIIEATYKALQDGSTKYVPNNGTHSLREVIAEKYSSMSIPTSSEQVVVTVGSSLSLFSLVAAIMQPGDECLVPLPGFPNYQSALSIMRAVSVPYLCTLSNNYLPTLDIIQKQVTSKTKCIIICNPGGFGQHVSFHTHRHQICTKSGNPMGAPIVIHTSIYECIAR